MKLQELLEFCMDLFKGNNKVGPGLPEGVKFLPKDIRPATEEEIESHRNRTFATFWPGGALKSVTYYDRSGEPDHFNSIYLEANSREGRYADTMRSYVEYYRGREILHVDCGDEATKSVRLISFKRFVTNGIGRYITPILLVLPPGRTILV